MPYFTSWDVNLYLCLMSLGLHHDISLSMTRGIKKVHRDYCLEEARSYYLDRKKWLPEDTVTSPLLRNRRGGRTGQFWIPFRREQVDLGHTYHERSFNLRAIVDIKSIPDKFWNNLGIVHFEYEDTVRKIEPEERNDYFEWAYENHYHGWSTDMLEWVKGFHPGRWILMDMKRGETLEDIHVASDCGAYSEERFILKQNHIEDLFN